MPEETMITDEMRAAIGREFKTNTSFPIDVSDIRRWAIGTYYPEEPPRLFWDAEYAATTPFGGIVAPEEFNPFAWPLYQLSDAEGEPAVSAWPEPALGIATPPARATIVAGMEATYSGVRMRPGDVIRSGTRLVEYVERRGRMGLTLYTTSEDRWTNQRGELIRTYRLTLARYK